MKVLALFILLSSIAQADCLSWFRSSGLKPIDKDCKIKCVVLDVDMGTYQCPDSCDKFCKPRKCDHDSYWKSKIKDGRPSDWDFKFEQTKSWQDSEKRELLPILDRLPDEFKKIPFSGLFRMQSSIELTNPATAHNDSIALYNRAFGNPFWTAEEVVLHEFGHLVFNSLSEDIRRSYRAHMEWKKDILGDSSRSGEFVSSRSKDGPDEDFAENFKYFLLKPDVLKSNVPKAFDWIKSKIGKNLKLKEKCEDDVKN